MYDTVGGNSEKIKKTELIIFILVWVKKFSTQFDHWTKPDKNNTSYLTQHNWNTSGLVMFLRIGMNAIRSSKPNRLNPNSLSSSKRTLLEISTHHVNLKDDKTPDLPRAPKDS